MSSTALEHRSAELSRGQSFTNRRRATISALASACLLALLLAAPAPAAAPDLLFQIPSDPTPGSAAGQLDLPRDIVGDPNTGHFFVSEYLNDRIGEFTAWGEFVKAWGWDVSPDGAPGDTVSDQFEICTTTCQAGDEGGGAGQFVNPVGLTIDAARNVYVYDGAAGANHRVQKFSSAGDFLLTFGGQVNLTRVEEREEQEANAEPVTVTPEQENLCTAASGDKCGPGVPGTPDGYFSNDSANHFIAHNPLTGTLFVGDVGRIQEFGLDGGFESEIAFEGELEAFKEREVRGLEVDSAGDLYITLGDPAFEASLDNIHKLGPGGELLSPTFPVKAPFSIAVDADDNVYAIESQLRVLGFDSSGKPITGMEPADGFAKPPFGVHLIGLGTNLCPGSESPGNLYVSAFLFGAHASIRAYGTPPIGCEEPPLEAPEIVDQYATSVGVEEAIVRAEINPHFWADTTYYVEYGTQQCLDSGWTEGCVSYPLQPGSTLTSTATNRPVTSAAVQLTDLESATTYHYRFVAQSTGSEGRPVTGVGGAVGTPGQSASFRTFPTPAAPQSDCPNAEHRIGSSAELSDCRAYEMVSPLDKNDSDIQVPINPNQYPVSLRQAGETGARITYSTSIAFGDVDGTPLVTQYLAHRDPALGWASEAISPPRTRQVGEFLEPEFKQFSPDLCQAWFRHDTDPPLTTDAVPGYFNLYRIDYCGVGNYEALTTEEPPNVSCGSNLGICPANYRPLELQGTTADGTKAVYVASDNLAGAPENTDERVQLYFFADGDLRFACIRPNGIPSPEGCSAGTYGNDDGNGRLSNLHNAISADGSLLYWSEGPKSGLQPGKIESRRLFVRQHPDREQSATLAGQCTEPDKACTYPVSSPVSPDRTNFWAAADDGSRAIFTVEAGAQAGNLYQFDLAKAKAGETANTMIAAGVKGLLGASQDATRIYFVSTQDLDGAGEAQAGQLNLYFHDSEAGAYKFIGALAPGDIGSGGVDRPAHIAPFYRSSRVTADGTHAAFTTPAPLTGSDNRDARSGQRDTEVFLYDAAADELICASCNPTGARPSGRQINLDKPSPPWIGARIPGWERALYPSRVLSDDGRRLFFESFEALVPEDSNGMQDVYQWERAGKGSCDEADPTYNPANGGCVELISSGTSSRDSSFLDASASGDDVFFTTLSSLVPPDYGLVDIYDARVNGGFAYPEPVKQCEGEACQSPPAAPDDPTPASSLFRGAGNVDESKACPKGRVLRRGRCVRKRCARGKLRRKGRCVSKKAPETRAGAGRPDQSGRAAG